jgi:hypothetical protein
MVVAMVSVSIRCSEQWAVVSMQPSTEKLVLIKSLDEIGKFAGSFVAYVEKSLSYDDSYIIKNPDNCHYGYLSKSSLPFISNADRGYLLSKLFYTNRPVIMHPDLSAHALSELFVKENNILMRKVTLEELAAIIRGFKGKKARIGYCDYKDDEDINNLVNNVRASILDIIDAVYGRYSERLLVWPASYEFREFSYCMQQQYSYVPNDLRRCMLRYLGLLKLKGCVEYGLL